MLWHRRTQVSAEEAAEVALRLRRLQLSEGPLTSGHAEGTAGSTDAEQSVGWVPATRAAMPSDLSRQDLREDPTPVAAPTQTTTPLPRLTTGTTSRGRQGALARPPVDLPAVRLGVRPPAVVGVAVMVGLAVLLAVAWAWQGRPRALEPLSLGPASHSSSGGGEAPGSPDGGSAPAGRSAGTQRRTSGSPADTSAQSGASPRVVVHVVGEVRRPGLVTLPEGSRIAAALAAAGGATRLADLTRLNLARRLSDGEQIVVVRPDQSPAPGVGGGGRSSTSPQGSSQPLDLNSATAEALDALPGVGPVLAQRIVSFREQHGSFRSVEELQEVQGIGPAKYDDLAPLVRV